MNETDWDSWGTGRNPKCNNCMAHCGYEGTAVEDTFAHPIKALLVYLRGPRTDGPMAPEVPITYDAGGTRVDDPEELLDRIPVTQV